MNYLYVCSGNTCRSPMAMSIAGAELGHDSVDSAAGNVSAGAFKAASFFVNPKAVKAIDALPAPHYGRYKPLAQYKPKPLSQKLVDWADVILFLGETFHKDAFKMFPSAIGKMGYYCTYDSDKHDVPDPYDGDHFEAAGLEYKKHTQDDYDAVALWMVEQMSFNERSRSASNTWLISDK